MNAFSLGFICVSLNILQTAPATTTVVFPRWEYRVLSREDVNDHGKRDLAAGLNHLGNDGWELAGIDQAYIFKRRLMDVARPDAELWKRAIPRIEADIALWKERVGWAERMLRKGYISQQRVDADRRQLQEAEAALENVKGRVDTLPPPIAIPNSPH